MKRIIFILTLLTCAIFSQAQNPIPVDSLFPIKQSVANAPTTLALTNVMQAKKGFINGVFVDTTTANLYNTTTGGYRLKYYPGAQIFTTSDSSFWLRNSTATRWMKAATGDIEITSFTFDNDTTGTICFGNGVCVTFDIFNLFDVVTNIVQNFNDSTIFKPNDSTLIICTGSGAAQVCDTIHLGSTNTYYFTQTGDTLITCDTVQFICTVPDSCYQQQLCDTIVLSQPPPITVYQNGVRRLNGTNIVEHGYLGEGANPSQLIHDTWLYTHQWGYTIQGAGFTTPFTVQQTQWTQNSSSIAKINHLGAYQPTFNLLDENNPVNLYFNYTDPFVIPTAGSQAGDTIGFMGNRYGYMLMTNSKGSQYKYTLDDANAKQVGIFFDTYTPNTEGVTIFAQQVPSTYELTGNNPADTTLLDQRVAIFHTDHHVQLPKYGVGTFTATPSTISGWDSQGNFVEIDTTDIGGSITYIDSTRIVICSFGDNLCDTVYTTTYINNLIGSGSIYAQNGLTALNDSTVELFGTVGTPATLLNDRYLTTGAFNLNISTSTGGVNPLSVIATTGIGVRGQATSGIAGKFEATSGFGVWAQSNTSVPLIVASNPATTNTVDNITTFYRQSSGTAANGIGMSISLQPQTSAGSQPIANEIISKWTDATHATRTSQYIVTGTNNAITADLFTLSGNGETRLNKYGVGSFTSGTGVYLAAFKADGTLMEFPTGGLPPGGGIITANNAVTMSTATNAQWGGTLIQNTTITESTFTTTFASSNVTGTTSSSALVFTGNSLTSGTGFYLSSTSLAGGSLVDMNVTSTAATGGTQKGLNILVAGANANASQNTYGIFSLNSHSGSSATNVGVYGEVQNGLASSSGVKGQANTQRGVWGDTQSGTGVVGSATNGTGGTFSATSGSGIIVSTTSGTAATIASDSGLPMIVASAASSTNTVIPIVRMSRTSTGTPANGIGSALDYYIADASGVNFLAIRAQSSLTDAANLTRTSQYKIIGTLNTATVDLFTANGDGSWDIRPITATDASAITPTEGKFVFVSNTNGTFTSIGIWVYQNGAWHAL